MFSRRLHPRAHLHVPKRLSGTIPGLCRRLRKSWLYQTRLSGRRDSTRPAARCPLALSLGRSCRWRGIRRRPPRSPAWLLCVCALSSSWLSGSVAGLYWAPSTNPCSRTAHLLACRALDTQQGRKRRGEKDGWTTSWRPGRTFGWRRRSALCWGQAPSGSSFSLCRARSVCSHLSCSSPPPWYAPGIVLLWEWYVVAATARLEGILDTVHVEKLAAKAMIVAATKLVIAVA